MRAKGLGNNNARKFEREGKRDRQGTRLIESIIEPTQRDRNRLRQLNFIKEAEVG